MPVTLSAKRKLRADAHKQEVNQKVEKAFRLAIKSFKKEPTKDSLKKVYSTLDVAAKKNVIPSTRVARKKSRLAILLVKTKPAASKIKSRPKVQRAKVQSRKIP